jgi:hypothetical protein
MKRGITRRTLLRGAAGATLALPFLNIMRARAGQQPIPKRILLFFTNNGTIKSAWEPTGSETSFTLGPILQPLDPYKSDLLVLSGIDVESSYHGPGSGDPHMPGMGHMLTGTELLSTGPDQYDRIGGGISVDQHIVDQLAAGTKFGSLHFGVQSRKYATNVWNTMSYRGANQPIAPEDDPTAGYNRIFGDLGTSPDELARLRAQRLSVLDAVKDDIGDVRGRLGAGDRIRLDQHLDSVRSLEQTIDNIGTPGTCAAPPVPGAVPGAFYDDANAPSLMRAQTDMLVQALACDLTRVASLQWRGALGGGYTMSWLGHTEDHHELSHQTSASGTQHMIEANTWFAQQLAYLLEAMRNVPEADGSTLLDHTVVLWCNELSNGAAHSRRGMMYVLAGSCGGYFRTGRYLTFSGDYHNNLLVSLCNAMDVPATSFGNPAYCTGELAGLT